MDRRGFLISSLSGLGTVYCGSLLPSQALGSDGVSGSPFEFGKSNSAGVSGEPHFMLVIYVAGGMDPSYLLDGRPLEMTKAGMIQNYLGTDPIPWTGLNGQTCLASTLANQSLSPFKNDFSVLNGVVMAHNFDGHDQNLNILLAGDAFGGESFIPLLNRSSTTLGSMSLDAIQNKSFSFGGISNLESTVNLSPEASKIFAEQLKSTVSELEKSPANQVLKARYAELARGSGRFSSGTRSMLSGMNRSLEIGRNFSNLALTGAGVTEEAKFVELTRELFKNRISRSVGLSLSTNKTVDAHGAKNAQEQPLLFTEILQKISTIFKLLKETPFDATHSLFDVTTVMVTSEFGRTMKQEKMAIDQTGTNHNALSNSFLIGGKGIRGGLVIGASDQDQVTSKVSKAHLAYDAERLKVMGRPFDFTTGKTRTDLPDNFNLSDYLLVGSVVNSIYQIFGVSPSKYRKIGRTNVVSPIVPGLLT